MVKKLLVVLTSTVLAIGLAVVLLGSGLMGSREDGGETMGPRLPRKMIRAREARRSVLDDSAAKQILFGDFHVHTTFSFDAFTMSLPMAGGAVGSALPADACDFARYCSAIDFWSINDHAEQLTPRLWQESIDAIKQCEALAGDGVDPDLVSFLGWEWTQTGPTPEEHFGHKNVVLADLSDASIPRRPIAAPEQGMPLFPGPVAGAMVALYRDERTLDMAAYLKALRDTPRCAGPEDESDCIEVAEDPNELFEKLDALDTRSLVIPHGTAWGIYTPPGIDWRKQLERYHDPNRQTLVEVYSGHGNSEQWIDSSAVTVDAKGVAHCPVATPSYTPSCQRAGEIIRERCLADGSDITECEQRASEARGNYAQSGLGGHRTVPGVDDWTDWLDAGQCKDCFLPAFNYRRGGAVQYMLAMSDFTARDGPSRFQFGFIGSSDNHSARPGNGYKEINRLVNADARYFIRSLWGLMPNGDPEPQSRALSEEQMRSALAKEPQRFTGFHYTGGLVAVHSEGRNREAIWNALEARETYGTSGPKILLWFDKVDAGERVPMGGRASQVEAPEFEVRAAGSFEQLPGCPNHAISGIGAERLAQLCQGECYNPSDTRRAITRIEVVKITPQQHPDEPVDGLIHDPWRVFPCAPDLDGCQVRFRDIEFAEEGRDSVYYARAIEEPMNTINADRLGCTYDDEGRCIAMRDCANNEAESDCVAPAEHRAWSSPIYVDYRTE